ELIRRHDVATFSLNRLDDDGGDFIGRDKVDKYLMFEILEALGGAVRGVQTDRAAVAVRVRRVVHTRHHRTEAAALDRFARGQRQRAERAAMEAAEKRDDVVASGRIPRQLDARLDRFSTRVAEKR